MILWRSRQRFRPGSNFGAWACVVAFNQVRTFRTDRRRDRLVLNNDLINAITDQMMNRDSLSQSRLAALKLCIANLPLDCRELIGQRYGDGQSIDDIARRSGRSKDAVYQMLTRARKRLAVCLNKRTNSDE